MDQVHRGLKILQDDIDGLEVKAQAYYDLKTKVRNISLRITRAAEDHRGPMCFKDLADELMEVLK